MNFANPDLSFLRAPPADGPPLATFEPQGWLRNTYVQTLFPFLVRRGELLSVERERWDTPDGDFLDVDIARPSPERPPRGFVIILHGLEGSSQSRYALGTLERAQACGLVGVAPNFRTCSGVMNRLPRAYHSGDSDELRFIVAETRRRFPGLAGGIVGYSLGGNVLAKYLGEEGGAVPDEVRGGVVVCAPLDVYACAVHMDRPQYWLVRQFFLRTLRAKALAKAARYPGLLDPAAIRRATTIRAFDDAATAPLHGFADAEDYWRRASAAPLIVGIARPCLILAADDDPIVPEPIVPRDVIRANPHLSLEESPCGGHVGFVAGTARAPRFYAEERAVAFIDDLIRRAS